MSKLAPQMFDPYDRGYFTPSLWGTVANERAPEEWYDLRARYARLRAGDFEAMSDFPGRYLQLEGRSQRVLAKNLLGDAGLDRTMREVGAFIEDAVFMPDTACDLCRSLGLWAGLDAVHPIMVAYDRWFPGDNADGLPAYLTTMLEFGFGVAADYPREDTVEAMVTYDAAVRALHAQKVAELGENAYAFFGERFSVRKVAERFLTLLGYSSYEKMMRPYLRQKFEASTGIDCSDFFSDGEFQPLTAAAKLEAWLASDEPSRYEEGERYFFGHKIPRSL